MAQILAPSAQWQMRMTKSSTDASPLTSKMWSSVVLKQNKKLAVKSSAKFRVFALQSDNATVNRMEQLLNLDVTPYTDKIIAEYIWYAILCYTHRILFTAQQCTWKIYINCVRQVFTFTTIIATSSSLWTD